MIFDGDAVLRYRSRCENGGGIKIIIIFRYNDSTPYSSIADILLCQWLISDEYETNAMIHEYAQFSSLFCSN